MNAAHAAQVWLSTALGQVESQANPVKQSRSQLVESTFWFSFWTLQPTIESGFRNQRTTSFHRDKDIALKYCKLVSGPTCHLSAASIMDGTWKNRDTLICVGIASVAMARWGYKRQLIHPFRVSLSPSLALQVAV